MGEVVTLTRIKKIRAKAKKEEKKVVITNGCFDIIHSGHLKYLKAAKRLGDILIVGLNSNPSVRKIKGAKRPIMDEKDRAYILSNLMSVDYVVLFDEPTPERLIRDILPDILVKGGDYKIGDILGRETVWECGGEVKVIPATKGYSTNKIIERIVKRYCTKWNRRGRRER